MEKKAQPGLLMGMDIVGFSLIFVGGALIRFVKMR
jgi:hypothetical protein